MKRNYLLAIIVLFVVACNNNRGWTANDRAKFINDCAGAAVEMGKDKARAYCECMQPKVEAKYATVAEANNVSTTEFQKPEWMSEVKKCLGMDDNTNIGGNTVDDKTDTDISSGTGWSDSDRDSWAKQCLQSLENQNHSERAKKNYCDCVGQKLEARYSNFDEMNRKGTYEEGKELGTQCSSALTGGGY